VRGEGETSEGFVVVEGKDERWEGKVRGERWEGKSIKISNYRGTWGGLGQEILARK